MINNMKKKNQDFLMFLRLISNKGFYQILKMIELNAPIRYNEILKKQGKVKWLEVMHL